MTFHDVLDVLLDGLLDSLEILPFLFVTYLVMEWIEHRTGDGVEKAVAKAGKLGPLVGGALGLVPQCGFSAMAAGLYAGRVVSVGTVLAVFLATSDEMIAVLLGEHIAAHKIFIILGIKFTVAVVMGFLADLFLRRRREPLQVEHFCHEEHCHCEHGILRSALRHTLQIFAFVLLFNLLLGFLLELWGEDNMAALMRDTPVLGECIAALIGLVPNCAASVAIATMYAKGVISAGAMLAGLLTGAGAGLLVLFRTSRNIKVCIAFPVALYVIGVGVGTLFHVTGLAAAWGL